MEIASAFMPNFVSASCKTECMHMTMYVCIWSTGNSVMNYMIVSAKNNRIENTKETRMQTTKWSYFCNWSISIDLDHQRCQGNWFAE